MSSSDLIGGAGWRACWLASLIALQEVVRTPERNQLDRLLNGTDLYGTHQAQVMVSAPPEVERYGGSAVATRWPHRLVEVLDLRLRRPSV
jgi:endonuclease/exonuclease/phosphatase family metal-dependent hydrolase